MAQPTASNQYMLAPATLSNAPEQLSAFNPSLIAAASVSVPISIPTDGGTFGSGPDTLVLTLAEDAFQGDAQANITIDGTTLTAQPITVTALKSAGQTEAFTFKGNFGSGAHDLGVSFLNDAYGGTPTTDRNLYVNGASYDGFSTRPASAVLDSTGTTHFTVPPAGDPEATPTVTDGGTFGSGPDTLVVTLAEDAFQGDAQANIAIDGTTLTTQPITVTALESAGQSETFTFKGSFGSGAHDLAVSFLNDTYGGTPVTDRNLYVNGASYNGISSYPATASLDSTGTTHLTVPPASDPAAITTTIDGGTFGSGPDTLVLTLAEDAFQGDAQANIAIDGITLTAQPITVTALKSAGQSEAFTFKGSFGSGAHDLGVSFLNDAYGGTPTTDRNLYVNGASYDGFSTRPASAVLDSTGTTHFTVPPAGDPEATPTITDGGTFGSGPDTLVVTLAEDAFQGDAQANIAIDGKMLNVQPVTFIAQPLTVTALNSAGQSEAFTFKGSFGSGAHDLAVSFLNDAYSGTPITDRNLYVNGASFNGISFNSATAALDSTGTTHFTSQPTANPGGAVGLIGAAQNTADAMHSIMPVLTVS